VTRGLHRDQLGTIEQPAYQMHISLRSQRGQRGITIIRMSRRRTRSVVVPAIQTLPRPSTVLPRCSAAAHTRQVGLTQSAR
jgi:hypothetical protein